MSVPVAVATPVAVPESQTEMKPLSWVKVNPQVRSVVDEEADRYLTESIKEHGVLQPPGALQDGTLIFGHRRVRCAVAAGLKEIPFFILNKPMTETEIKVLQLTENIHRADLTGAEKWQSGVDLLNLNPTWSQKDLAHHLKFNEGTITKLLSPSKCIKPVQEALVAGKLGISDCYPISKLSEIEQIEALAMKLNGGITNREGLAALARRQKRNGHAEQPAVGISRLSIPYPSGAKIVISGESLSLEDVINLLQETVKAAKKACDEGIDGKTWCRVMSQKAQAKGG